MGAGGSTTRTLTVKNEEPHIIVLTTDVMNRITHGYQVPQPEPQPPQQESGETEIQRRSGVIKGEGAGEERVALSVGSGGHEVLETVSALQVRKEKDEELVANDFFWRSKLKELEGRYVASAFTSEQEFSSQLADLQKLMPERRKVVCEEISPQVANCYAANPKQVLKCSHLVQEFAKCAERTFGETLSA